MSEEGSDLQEQEEVREYLEGFFGLEVPEPEPGLDIKAHATLTRKNQPEFYADAPWRVEPDLDHIPLLFAVREANLKPPGLGPWCLDELKIEQKLADGTWREVRSYRPSQLPAIDAHGFFERPYWSFGTRIGLQTLRDIDPQARDETVYLRVVYSGSFPPHQELDPKPPTRYLQVFLSSSPLPLSRATANDGRRHWFLGDTHYHSSYTNDIWEFGNPVRDARSAAAAIGLDWLVITDHSCDLDDLDADADGRTRWERLKAELVKPTISNRHFRVILGEEVTLYNASRGYIHMLALGSLGDLIPGGFWSEGDPKIKAVAKFINDLVSHLGGYPKDAIERLFGHVLDLDQVLARVPAQALTFAAHPYDQAQPPFLKSTWVEEELADGRLTGHEFWNGRSRRQTDVLVDPTDNPFEESEWDDPDKLKKSDKARVKRLRKRTEKKWEIVLKKGVDEWADGDELPRLRPVFVAGSDAHGDFNYSVGVGWDYRQHGWITDNALGRVRTVVHLPDHASDNVPTRDSILGALRKGACLVTDGPAVEFSLHQNGQVAYLGDLLTLSGDGEAEIDIVAHSTAEFGPVQQVELVTYLQGQPKKRPIKTVIGTGSPETIELKGRRGYCRVQAWTVGRDGERFCCFTNPIWIRIADGERKKVRVLLRQQ